MDRHPSGGLLFLLRLEREQSSLTVPSAEVHDGLQPRAGQGCNHHQVVHRGAGGASEQLANLLVGEGPLQFVMRRGGFRYLNLLPHVGLDKLPVTRSRLLPISTSATSRLRPALAGARCK
jgi:hypothetical protein